MPTVELILRLLILGQFALLIPMLILHRADNRSYGYCALLLLGVAAYLLAPLVWREWQWGLASFPIIFLAIVVPAFFWYFVGAVFSDDFSPHRGIKWLVLATGVVGLLAFCGSPEAQRFCPQIKFQVFEPLAWASKTMWIASALYILVREWQTDLVESRRFLRRFIAIAGGCYIAAIITIEVFLPEPVPTNLELMNVGALFVAFSMLCFHFMRINSSNIFARLAPTPPRPGPERSPLAQQLVSLMASERAHAIEALTIKSLAQLLQTQPYQLRQVINGELGFRNFNAFINLYRIQEVAQRMEHEEFRDSPLLTLALDAGFRSLAPFNRSFKDHYGVTPSEYRQQLPFNK